MNKRLRRKQAIIQALVELGGTATTREISEQVGLNTNGVSQSLGTIDGIRQVGIGRGSATLWQVIRRSEPRVQDPQLTLGGIK
jgi:FaeA-like protein